MNGFKVYSSHKKYKLRATKRDHKELLQIIYDYEGIRNQFDDTPIYQGFYNRFKTEQLKSRCGGAIQSVQKHV